MSTVKNKEVSKTKKINSIIKFNIMAIILIAICKMILFIQ